MKYCGIAVIKGVCSAVAKYPATKNTAAPTLNVHVRETFFAGRWRSGLVITMFARGTKSCRCSTTFLSANKFRFRLCVLRMLAPAHCIKCERGVRCTINYFPARSMRRLLLCILINTKNKRIIVFKLISIVQALSYRPVKMLR